MKIALLEDEANLASQLTDVLASAGLECCHFDRAHRFCHAVTHDNFDLLIMDWQVPDMDGLQALTHLRSVLDWPIPVLFLTQRDSEADIVKALNAGADDFMIKPARPAELIARITALSRLSSTAKKKNNASPEGKKERRKERKKAHNSPLCCQTTVVRAVVPHQRQSATLPGRTKCNEPVFGSKQEILKVFLCFY